MATKHIPKTLKEGYVRCKVGVSYAGNRYSGWIGQTHNPPSTSTPPAQLPPDSIGAETAVSRPKTYYKRPSVSSALDAAFGRFTDGKHLNLRGSSRTDTGVSAMRNVFQVDVPLKADRPFAAEAFAVGVKRGVNFHLKPADRAFNSIVVTDVECMDASFDARADATARTYVYRVIVPRRPQNMSNDEISQRLESQKYLGFPGQIFHSSSAWLLNEPLDLEAMRRAASKLIGLHDFSSFRGKDCQSKSPIRRLMSIDISAIANPADDFSSLLLHESQELVTIRIKGNSFVRRMCRNIVGTLIEIGSDGGIVRESDMDFILSCNDRSKNGSKPAPAKGLILVDVHYGKAEDVP